LQLSYQTFFITSIRSYNKMVVISILAVAYEDPSAEGTC
jgi:hypothetical protein